MSNTQDKKRKVIFIDSEVQGGILRRIVCHWMMLVVCSTLMLMVWVRLFEAPEKSWEEVFQLCYTRFAPFMIVSLTLIPAFARDTVKFSNRFAGPMVRLRGALKMAGAGDAPKHISFRKGDYWQDIARSFNQLADRINQQQEENEALRAENQSLKSTSQSIS